MSIGLVTGIENKATAIVKCGVDCICACAKTIASELPRDVKEMLIKQQQDMARTQMQLIHTQPAGKDDK